MTASRVQVAAGLLLNIACSVAIVITNKWIYTKLHFPNLTMTCVHFVVTAIGMEICARARVFSVKSIPMKDMLLLSLTFCGFVVFTNLSLQANSVGTYQISKFMTTPCIMLIQSTWYAKSFPISTILTLVPICVGVVMNNYYDVRLNLVGTTYAALGVVVTSLYQVWVGEKQSQFQADSMQLLYYQAPLSALLLALLVPWIEPVIAEGGIFHGGWSLSDVGTVLGSGVIAFMVNLTIFWVIGNTSALTYNMAGHLKFCLVALGGYLLFEDSLSLVQLTGVALTLTGVGMYTKLRLAANSSAPKTSVLPMTSK